MRYQETLLLLHELFYRQAIASDVVQIVNAALFHLSHEEKSRLYSDLTEAALNGLYPLLDELLLPTEAKEHLTYRYFLVLSKVAAQHRMDRRLLQQISREYDRTSYVALESLLISLLKENRIHEGDLDILEHIHTKAMIKETFASRVRAKIANGKYLSTDDVKKLLEYKKYAMLQEALLQNAVEYETLYLFVPPNTGDQNYKHKNRLYLCASQLLRK
ncbi:hypothetical protein MH117_17425 [Paenibacillus sp. ACRRX]|uniref:hypothetical protein n=1 Tax=Paenibacillus sp. ACRRX TaxID=2918206 RepID=UPI001EF4B4D9|nr:hypothetical protein [Paenibacillus sp. ACRRX]MCG7409201.1 hypothetical protein [Paenibacillus sp. ACRRX]